MDAMSWPPVIMLYYRLSVLSALLAIAVPFITFATPLASSWGEMRVKHSWDTIPENWESLGPPLAGTTIDLRIALKPNRENALIDSLYEVSTPNYPKYGAHLSQEQVAELVAPHPDTLELVESWLKHYGVPSSSFSMIHTGNWLKVTSVPVTQANELLGASYELFRHAETNETILRTIKYALPAELHAHVQTVAPTTYFASASTLRKTLPMHPGGAVSAGPPRGVTRRDGGDTYVKPSFLRWLYNSETYVPKATDRNVLGVTGYHGKYPSFTDLRSFMQRYRADGLYATFKLLLINGASGARFSFIPGMEANVNIQYTQGMTFPTPHLFYSTSGLPPFNPDSNTPINENEPVNENEPFLDWLEYILNPFAPRIPQTISTSYGDNEQTVPPDYAMSVCRLFAQLGNRGVSVLTSSGNDGVGAGGCVSNDGSPKVQFLPQFPSSCPWVTSVGGTGYPVPGYPATGDRYPETAASFSSGGFSNYFEVPDYQRYAVSTFIRNLDGQHNGLYNASSRGFPDIAAQAKDFVVTFDQIVHFYGSSTRCAAPVAASIISLLNDFLLFQNKDPLGFLNPWLYGRGQVGLNDITSGSNPGCGTEGFSAVQGWDPVTGLGTPDFLELQKMLIAFRRHRPPAP